MIEPRQSYGNRQTGIPEPRYAYYRRCQVFRENGLQCKAPAEKGEHTCYSHAGQRELALRRERERRAVLEEVVRRMRSRGKPEFQTADIFMDFNAIQVTLAVMAQALIDGRIDCKTAGRLAVVVQMAVKLLRLYHRGHRGTRSGKTRGESRRISPLIRTDDTDQVKARLSKEARPPALPETPELPDRPKSPDLRELPGLLSRGHRGARSGKTALTTKDTKDHKGEPEPVCSEGRETLPLIHGTHGKPGRAPGQVNADDTGPNWGKWQEPAQIRVEERKRGESRMAEGPRIVGVAKEKQLEAA